MPHITPVDCGKIEPKMISAFIKNSLAKNEIEASEDSIDKLILFCDSDMTRITNELEKLISYVLSQGREVIEPNDINNITAPNKEISPFDFTNALMRRDAKTALYILSDMKYRGEDPIIILSTVSRVLADLIRVRGCMDKGMTKAEISQKYSMHEYKVKLYMEQLKNVETLSLFAIAESARNADVALKSSPVDRFTLLERLICELVSLR
jgi:DNA polymerase-3 subunit delta